MTRSLNRLGRPVSCHPSPDLSGMEGEQWKRKEVNCRRCCFGLKLQSLVARGSVCSEIGYEEPPSLLLRTEGGSAAS